MAWNLHAIEQARLRQHRVDGVGRLKSDFHTGLRLCLWCLCSLCSSSEAMVMVGSPRARHGAASSATAAASAAAQRSMDLVQKLRAAAARPMCCRWLPFCFAKISEFWTRKATRRQACLPALPPSSRRAEKAGATHVRRSPQQGVK